MKKLNSLEIKVIKVVSIDKLKKEFSNVETDKINDLSCADADKIVESLVYKMLKGFKDGKVNENPDLHDAIDELNNFSDKAKYKFTNVNGVINDRKFSYILDAYITADAIVRNQIFKELAGIEHALNTNLSCNIHLLVILLEIYYYNYSNYGIMQDLMFNLSADDDLPLTFEIHDKYVYGDEFGVNHQLMKDLDFNIKVTTETILKLIKGMDKIYPADDIVDVEKETDAAVDSLKNQLKEIYGDANEFKTIALSESGFDDALIDSIKIDRDRLLANNRYIELKKSFMDLYNGNAFKELSEIKFECYKEKYGDAADFNEFMKKEPAYNLKECKFIYPEKSGIDRNN